MAAFYAWRKFSLHEFHNGQGYPHGQLCRIPLKASADAEQVAQDHVKGKHQDNDKGSDKGKGKGKVKDKGKGGHALADAGLTATSWTSTV